MAMYIDLETLDPTKAGVMVTTEEYLELKKNREQTESTQNEGEGTNSELDILHTEYEELFKVKVPNNKKNNTERISSKIAEEKARILAEESAQHFWDPVKTDGEGIPPQANTPTGAEGDDE